MKNRLLNVVLTIMVCSTQYLFGQSVRPIPGTNQYTMELDGPELTINIPARFRGRGVCSQGGTDDGFDERDYAFTYNGSGCAFNPFSNGCFTRRTSSTRARTRQSGTGPAEGSYQMTIEGYTKRHVFIGTDCEIVYEWRNWGSVNVIYEDFRAVGATSQSFCVYEGGINDLNVLTSYPAAWSGPGVSGNRFTPSSAGSGTHTIRARRAYNNGTFDINFTFTVTPRPNVEASGNFTRCEGDADVILGGTPSGGTWSGNGVVSGSAFDPGRAGVGNHTLTYTYTNSNGCINSDSRVATVGAIPNANAGSDFDVCIGNFRSLSGSPAGGTWSGPGVVGNSFNSTTAGSGSHTLTYSYTSSLGCVDTDQLRARVNDLPSVDAGSDDQRCISSSSVNLSGSPSGGTWTGPGMSGNTFRPSVAGLGNHTLTYSYTNSNGCTNTDTKSFAVVAAPTVNAGSNQTVCVDDSRFFVGGFSPTGGTWSGPGINSSGRFDPGDAGIGTHTMTYNWSDGSGCSGSDTKNITVRGLPSVNAGSNVTYCVGSGRYTQSGSPSGGSWSGQGMSGSRFDTDVVGPGNYTITYTYTDGNGCSNSDSKVVTVQSGPSVNAGSDQTVCVTSLPFSLSGVSPSGGNWDAHPGISGNTFTPANAGVGTHILRYRFTNPFGCDGFDSKTVNVLAQPTIDVGSDINVCVSDPEFLITGALPAGGSWAGDGVVAASRFNAALAGVGTHVITYTYTNASGCSNSAAKNVVVTGLASVEAGVDLNRCINAGILTLDGESPTGGTWSGSGVVNGNEFNPVLAGLGVHEVIYSYADMNGCIATDSRNVIVDNADPIDAGRNQLACITDAPFPLDGASEPGGTWSGPGVSGNLFDASVAGVGTHELTYDFISLGGCSSSDITFITVVANDPIDAGDPITLCINEGFFNLQNGVSVTGGDFSGNGVVSNAFDPSLAGLGTHTITYEVTNPNGCLTSDTREVTVIDPAPVDIGVDITFCVSDLPYDLSADVTVTGGTFSGLGVVGSNFDPSLVGAGAFEISYEVNDANGCASTDTRIVYVTSPGEVDAGQNFAVCAGSGVVDLSQNASPNTGVWSGMGITGNIFDPTVLTPDDYVLRYTITNGFGCDAFDEILVTVTNALVIDAGPDQNVCEGGEALDLYTVVSIPGGDFKGENISGNIFDVQRADPGTYAITYNYSNEFGCDDSDVLIITVNAVPEVVAGSDIDVCLNQDPVDLTIGAIPSGGSFEGAGVIGNFFNPAIAGIGRHDVFYTYTNVNGCSTTEVREITVKDLPQVEVGNNLVLCIDQGAYDLGEDVDPLGGVWSGSGVELSNFEPLVAGIGIHQLVYTVTLPSGCTNSATQFITVVEPESVYAGDDMVVCTSTNSIDLSATATPFGGEFDGVGVSGLNFRPSSVSPGEYTITYTYNSAGCDVVDTRKITVTDVPTVNAGPDRDLCINQDPVDMSVGTFPGGGILSGPGLAGNVFNPARAGLGEHVLTYTYASAGGCVVTDQKVITVEEPPTINAGGNVSHCINGGQINLALDVSESGGVFFGTGVVSGGIFDPVIAGIGTHQITYTFSQVNGCVSTDTRLITINNIPVLDIGSDFELCTNAGTYPLTDDVNITGGVFSGPGVSGNILDPSRLSPGSYNIEYELETSEGCLATDVRTITIVVPDIVDAGPNVEVCLGESLDLNLSVSIPGGNFLGSGVNGNAFSSTAAGIGEHEITYSIIDANGCDAEDTRTIEVVAPITIDAGENVSICYDDGQYNLFDDVDQAGGYFIGNGIVGGFFDPQIAGEGVHVLTYRLETSPLCISVDTKVITVTRPIDVDAGMDITLCTDDGVYNLAADVNLSGGEFDGVGVNGSSFDPGDVSPGSYTITYTRLDAQGCSSVDERTIEVFGLPTLEIGSDIELCVNSSPINLALAAIPSGGTFIGNGISGNFFDPQASGTGVHVIRYEYENPVSGCENTTTRTLTVVNPRVVGVPPIIVECIDGNVIDLNREDGVIDGTIFTGPGISNNNFFPSVAGAGIHEITATLDEGNGCLSSRTFEAIISALPDLDFGVDLEVCIDQGIIDLSQEVNLLGGEFDGIGVNSNNFDPKSAGPGNFVITYDFIDGNGCSNSISKNIRVIGLADIELGADRSTCIGAGTIDLNVIASPAGGSWSGVGVDVTNIFDPTVAGIGDHVLTYTYIDPVSGCESSESIEIDVDDSPNIEVPNELRMCLSDPRIDLRDLDDIISGTQFSGTGVVNNEFNPAVAGVGVHTITAVIHVTVDCSNSDTFEIIVSDPTVVDFGSDLTMCSNDALVDLTSKVDVQGGIFSGTGVNGSLFDPSEAGFGTHILDYQYTNGQGCTTTAFKAITVNSSPDVRIDDDDPRVFCEDDNRLNLLGLTDDAGTWSGTGVSGIFFDPTVAGIGDHWIYLSASGSAGCNGIDSVLFSVVGVPSVSFDPAPITLCEAGNKIDLSALVNIDGGDFSGPGVDGTLFDPTETGIGSFQVRYEYISDQGCEVTVGKQIIVSPLPNVGAGNNVTLCLNQAPVDLTIGSFPLGGSYTGPGVIGNDFDPAQAGIGDHTITYSFVDANGCSGTDQRVITVNGGPQLEVGDNFVMCTDENFYDLNQDVNITGGTWSGPGITLSNFYPAVAGEGAHELVYTYVEAGGCNAVARRFVTVVSPGSSVAVDAGPDLTVCNSASIIDLSLDATPAGGVFSGIGVVGLSFDPSQLVPGIYTVNYSVDNGGCSSNGSRKITVVQDPLINAGADAEQCVSSTTFDLSIGSFPSGGSYIGAGVTGNNFNASAAGLGQHLISYIYDDPSGCRVTDTRLLTVSGPGVVDAGDDVVLCIGDENINLLQGTSEGSGEFTGTGVVLARFFDPGVAGVGNHIMSYSFISPNGCVSTDTKVITVLDVPALDIGSDIDVCRNAASINLVRDATVRGGEFNGIGVNNGFFNPNELDPGIYTVEYSIENGQGCIATASRDITVVAEPVVNAGAGIERCIDAADIDLSAMGTPVGGSWSGPGINIANTFEPTLAGIGEHELSYTYTDPLSGCAATDILQVSVVDIPQLEEPSTIVVCASDPTVNLKELDEATSGVTFSGTGVVNGIFDPSVAGQGNHVITMAVDLGAGCTNSLQFSIIVNPTTTIDFGADQVLCSNEDPVNLVSEVNVVGGVYEGQGVNGSVFDPAQAGFGTHILTYTFTNGNGCVSTDTKVITVNTVADVTIDDDEPIETCINADRIVLSGLSDSPGTWTGSGVSGFNFQPSVAGVGDHWIKLTATGQGGCQDADSVLISVYDVPVVEFSPEPVALCSFEGPINLNSIVNVTGGQFSGIGVSNSVFSPSGLTAGDYEISYEFTTLRGCTTRSSKTITVLEQPIVNAGSDLLICVDAASLDLSSRGAPSGGLWTGPGINMANTFEPALAGVGMHQLRYTYIDSSTGCANSDIVDILVEDAVVLEAPSAIFVCEDDSPLRLTNIEGIISGVQFSGIGVENGIFTPSIAGPGNVEISMSYDEGNGCLATTSFSIVVNQVPTIDFGTDLTMCVNDPAIDLVGQIDILGGVFEGPGLSGSVFSPSLAGFGTHIIQYQLQLNGGCIATARKTISVLQVDDISINDKAPRNLCINDERLLLANLSENGGVWSGSGVSGFYFDPSSAGSGDHWIYLSSLGQSGCEDKDSVFVSVNDVPVVNWTVSELAMCQSDNRLNLNEYVTLAGGTFSGSGVEGNYLNPQGLESGNYQLSYQYVTSSGCEVVVNNNIEIRALPIVNAGANLVRCVDADVIDLSLIGTPSGGSWVGPGITGANQFEGNVAGIGRHELSYVYEDIVTGCSASDKLIIEIENVPGLQVPNTIVMCSSDGSVNLKDIDQATDEVVFSGLGVENDIFNPINAGAGNHLITMSINDGVECFNEVEFVIVVNDVSVLSFGETLEVCSNDAAIDLVGEVNVIGGEFSGNGVQGSIFDPKQAGFGTHVIRYRYTNDAGCESSIIKVIKVNQVDEVEISDKNRIEVCENEERVLLSSISNGIGQWSGIGVEGFSFDPAVSGIGDHWIKLSSTGVGGCVDTDSVLISVYSVPVIGFVPEHVNLCVGDDRKDLNQLVNLRGGVFSGEGVSGNFFESADMIPGSYEIKYDYTTPRGCIVSTVKSIEVVGVPLVDAGLDLEKCIDVGIIELGELGKPFGGIWTGRGVNANNQYDPALSGIGNHELTYTYSDPVTGCTGIDILEAQILESVELDIPQSISVCATDGLYNLNDLDEATRGVVFTGEGLDEGFFDPAAVEIGVTRITMEIDNGNGCEASVGFNIIVNEVVDIDFGNDLVMCSNDAPIDLVSEVNVIGGEFDGRGVSGSVFDPESAGFGTHVISYSYVNGNGCGSSGNKVITVNQVLPIELDKDPIAMCIIDERLVLSSLSESSGTWSGNGVSGIHFDPLVAGRGDHWIVLESVALGGCIDKDSVNVTIVDIAEISFNQAQVRVCEDDNSIDLSGLVNIEGGEFSGPGVEGNLFDPSQTGRGTFRISYSLLRGGLCESTVSKQIEVISLPTVQAGSDVVVCLDSTLVDLSIGAFPIGGTFEGAGVEGDKFSALQAGPGIHSIVYRYLSGEQGCEASATKTIEVLSTDRVFAGPNIELCISGNALDLSESVSPEGGVFFGEGVNGDFFYPSASGIGEFEVRYVITSDRGCVSSAVRKVIVNEEQELDVGEDLTLCINESPVILDREVSIPGGKWTGKGVTSNVFDIDSAGVGVHILTYIVTTADGCELEATKIMRVNEVNEIEIGDNLSSCVQGDRINLIGNFNTDFVRISGPGVIGGFEFDPAEAGSGTHEIVYEFLNDNGCVYRDERYITVAQEVFVAVDRDFAICQGAGEIDLTDRGYPRGEGVWIGNGVESNGFDPSSLDPGRYELEYRVDLGFGCSNSALMNIDVVAGDITGFGRDTILCVNSVEIELNNAELMGGNWNGIGVINNKFYPSQSGPGEFVIEYTNDDYQCDIVGRRKITVVDVPELATVEEYDIAGCRGDVVRLTANIISNDNSQVINYEWYKEGEVESFARGKSINYVLDVNENIYFRSVNQFGCTSNQADFIRLTVNGAFGFIEVDQDTVDTGDLVRFKSVVSNAESYHWNFGDGNFSTESNPVYIYHTPGNKNVSLNLTSSDGCEFLIEEDGFITILDRLITGIEPARIKVMVYPVPVEDLLNVKIEGDRITEWELYDLNGKKIDYREDVGIGELTIDVGGVNIGTYMLMMRTQSGDIVIKKIVKQ